MCIYHLIGLRVSIIKNWYALAVIFDDAAGGVQYLRQSILFFENRRTETLLNCLVLPIKHPYIKIDHVETLISFIETLFSYLALVDIKDVIALHCAAFLTLCGQYKI